MIDIEKIIAEKLEEILQNSKNVDGSIEAKLNAIFKKSLRGEKPTHSDIDALLKKITLNSGD